MGRFQQHLGRAWTQYAWFHGIGLAALLAGRVWSQVDLVDDQRVPTRQWIQPAGRSISYPARPVDLAISQDGRWVVVKDNRGLAFIDAERCQILQRLLFPEGGGSMHGVHLDEGAKSVWATTAQSMLYEAQRDEQNRWHWRRAIHLPGPSADEASHACGIAVDSARRRLYVCLSRNNTLGVVDLDSGQLLRQIPVGVAPYDVILLPGEQRAVVSNWGGRHPRPGERTLPSSGTPTLVDDRGVAMSGSVGEVDLVRDQQIRETATGLHPADLIWDAHRQHVMVANANSDSVTVLDGADLSSLATLSVRPDADLPFGSASNALAISTDGTKVFVANAGNNAVAVLSNASENATGWQLQGFIPTAWYPAALALHNDQIWVANTKGYGSRADGADSKRSVYSYLGVVSSVPIPTDDELTSMTQQVHKNSNVPAMLAALERQVVAATSSPVPIPKHLGEPSVFEHVVYVIKENRTYDQVLGDLPQGNGDPQLCLYPRAITPNQHALAEQFVILDNYYCNGVNSADGHAWSTEGNVTDHLEKSFGGFTRSYTFGDDPLTYSSTGFIWDNVLLHGLSFRNYGEMDYTETIPADATFQQIWEDFRAGRNQIQFRHQIGIPTLARYSCPDYPGWNMKIPDVLRADRFIRELEAAEKLNRWYNFMMVYLPQDHTSGLSEGLPTPEAHVADNDLAVGRLVAAVSRSRFWAHTCIFVIEDDPQDGFDHVDGHRSLCYVISPYSQRGVVVSEFYNQTSVLHTMERILGLPPMNQMDAMSPLMSACFDSQPNLNPYEPLTPAIALDSLTAAEKSASPAMRRWYAASRQQDFQGFDRAEEETLNRILWHAARGASADYPEHLAGAHGAGLPARGLSLTPNHDEDD